MADPDTLGANDLVGRQLPSSLRLDVRPGEHRDPTLCLTRRVDPRADDGLPVR